MTAYGDDPRDVGVEPYTRVVIRAGIVEAAIGRLLDELVDTFAGSTPIGRACLALVDAGDGKTAGAVNGHIDLLVRAQALAGHLEQLVERWPLAPVPGLEAVPDVDELDPDDVAGLCVLAVRTNARHLLEVDDPGRTGAATERAAALATSLDALDAALARIDANR